MSSQATKVERLEFAREDSVSGKKVKIMPLIDSGANECFIEPLVCPTEELTEVHGVTDLTPPL